MDYADSRGGIVITGIDGQIKLVVGPKDLANEIEEFCSQCSEPIRNAIGAVWKNVLALQNVQATPIPFHGPLTVGVGDEQAFSSDPVSGPAPLKASLPSLEAIGCGNVEAKVIGLEFFFDLPTVIVLPTPPPPDPSIAAVIPAPTIQNLGNNHFQLHVTLRGVSPGDTTLIADVFLGQVGIEASLGASFFPVFGCPATVVPRVEGHANLTGYYAADFASPKTPGVTVSVKGPTPTPTPTPFGQELSDTITYTGSRVQVSASEPIIILLAAFDPNVHGVDRAYVPVNGGPFVLHAPAAGNYYLLYSVDVHNYQDGALSVGAPFEVYNNRYTVSFPAPFPADPVVVPQVGFNLDFGDAGIITGVAGTVAYTGNRSCGCIDIEAFANPGFSGAPDRDWYDSGCREPNGRYELAFLDPGRPYYLRAFVDINDNRQLDPGEPFAIYGSNPVAAGPAQTNVNFSFGDPIAPAAQGLRVYVAPGSTGNAYVYGGPIPSSSNGGDIADHPESHGYVFLGTIGVGSNGPYDFDGPYPYFLIKVTSSVIIPGSPSVNIDALQNIETSTFLSGRTCNGPPGLAFYDSNAGSLDNTKGPPDGEYSQLNGYMLYPVIAWSAY